MRFKAVLLVSTLFAVLLVLAQSLDASACIPTDDGTRCEAVRLLLPRPTPKAVVAKPTAIAVAAPAKRGSGPGDALQMVDTLQKIEPGQNIWYEIGSGVNPQRFEVWLDAKGQSGIGFSVFAPDQMGDWSPATPPKGRGSPNRSDLSHDLSWIGQAPIGGTWFVVVTNSSSGPISYQLTYTRVEMLRRDCGGAYWEYFPNGAYVQWPGYCK